MEIKQNQVSERQVATAVWSDRFSAFLDWTPNRRAVVSLALFVLPAHVVYWLMFELLVADEGLVHDHPMRLMLWGWMATIILGLGICHLADRRQSSSLLPFHLANFMYSAWMLAFIYALGGMDSAYTGFLLIAPVSIWVMGGARLLLQTLVVSFVTLTILGVLTHWQSLPYAPLVADRAFDARTHLGYYMLSLFWMIEASVGLFLWFFLSENSRRHVIESLRNSQLLIRRYVPPALAEHIISGHKDDIEAPQRRRVTVLFSDIVGFTELADRVEPEVVSQVIGEYMAAMAEIVDAHKGTVNEFIGDGLMALFGAPVVLPPEEQARQAVNAAQAMQARLPELSTRWRKLGLGAPLQIRVGIHTGVCSVGSYGSEGRMTYTAIGLQTNIAARLQSHCEPGAILLSDATWQLVRDEIECTPRGEVECKGVHFPISVYSPTDAQQRAPAERGP